MAVTVTVVLVITCGGSSVGGSHGVGRDDLSYDWGG